MLPNMMKFAALEQKTHEVIASASRKIEQEAEADTADDQAREHDLVNTSAPMPANPKHIDMMIMIITTILRLLQGCGMTQTVRSLRVCFGPSRRPGLQGKGSWGD